MYPILTWDADQIVGISGNFPPRGDIPELYSYADIQVVPGEATVWGAQSISGARDRVDSDQLAAAGLEEAETMTQEDSFSAEEPAACTVGADLSLHIEVPVKDLAAVLEAYQKDLSMLSFSGD